MPDPSIVGKTRRPWREEPVPPTGPDRRRTAYRIAPASRAHAAPADTANPGVRKGRAGSRGRTRGPWPRIAEMTRPTRTHLLNQPEDSCYVFGPAGHELTLYRSGVDAATVSAVCDAPLTLAACVVAPLLTVLYRFQDVPLLRGHAPFAWHLLPPEYQVVPDEVGPLVSSRLTLRLIDTDSLQTRAVRSLRLPDDFAARLGRAIGAQAAVPFDPLAYTWALAASRLDPRDFWARDEQIVARADALA